MTSRIPEPGSGMEDEGLPEMDYTRAEKEVTGDPQEGMAMPGDVQTATGDLDEVGAVGTVGPGEFGTTAREQYEGEPLSGRLDREEPDVLSDEAVLAGADERAGTDDPFPATGGGVQAAGRLVEPDEGARTDDEPDAVARDVGADQGGFSAEEAAVHVEPEV